MPLAVATSTNTAEVCAADSVIVKLATFVAEFPSTTVTSLIDRAGPEPPLSSLRMVMAAWASATVAPCTSDRLM